MEIEITGLNHEGDGVGRYAGKVVFIAGALPGDVVDAAITQERSSYSRAGVLSIKKPSCFRTSPQCGVFEECGGCSLQIMDYGAQLTWKRRIVEDAVIRIGGLQGVTIHDTVASPSVWHYRNKAMFPVGRLGDRLVAGCYRRGTHEIVPSASCKIQHPTNNLILSEILRLCGEYGIPPYDEQTGRGVLRHIMGRVAVGTGESMAVLVTATRKMPYAGPIGKALAEAVPGLVSVVQNVNPERTNIVLGREWRVIWGREYIDDLFGNERIGRRHFRVSPLSFYQVNPEQAAQVYAKALEFLETGPHATRDRAALDLYCGIGTITLFLASRFAAATGVEENGEAVRDARRNARINGIENVRFVEGRAERVVPSLAAELAASGTAPEAIVLDPPRAGCEKPVLEVIGRVRPRSISYVSCYPSTLARDLAHLVSLGYRAVEVQPFDMFPHTPHVESVARLEINRLGSGIRKG
ncbi:MAG: 23S rRNA (uracil(1939)-C(5))-methyltransferase RlmD [Bacillota bacterium]